MSKTDTTIYEIGYNLIPTVSAEEVAKEVGAIKEKITSLGGEIISDEYPVLSKLAYDMTKEIDNKNVRFSSAYFGWVKFETQPEHIAAINKMAESNMKMLRFILIKTVRENTMFTPKFTKPAKRTASGEGEDVAVALPMDEAAVDKKISELIDEEVSL